VANWTHKRTAPEGKEAIAGELGTIANCLGGDLVCAESQDGERFAWLEIAWPLKSGDAMAHVWNPERGRIDLRAPFLRQVKATQRCRFLGVRSK